MHRYPLRPPTTEDLRCAGRWLRRLDDHGLEAGERDHCARVALPPKWRTRDRLREPLWPAQTPDTIHIWAAIGASDALSMTPPRAIDQRPHALAYTAAWTAVMEAYMTTAPDVTTTLHVPEGGIDPQLAAAWVRAVRNAPELERDATNEQTGHYTSADGVAAQARLILANEGLLWAPVGDRLGPTTLSTSDIGSRNYVGDVILDWMLIHESGAVLRATSTAAVVAMKATPHDKAVQAAKTYLSGNVMRGLLCFVREDKHSTDARLDREANGEPEFVACDPKSAKAIGALCTKISGLAGCTREEVFRGAWRNTGHEYNVEVDEPGKLSPAEAVEMHRWLDNDYRTSYPDADDQSGGNYPEDPDGGIPGAR